ncbi:MAG: hypothetical protein ACE5EE_03865 [Fidelibacterota bacterium]
MEEKALLYYKYIFVFENGREVPFEVNLNPETLQYIPSGNQEIPSWARFNHLPCELCIEYHEKMDYCPIAVNIAEVIDAFQDVYSYDTVDVTVETVDRVYFKENISTQRAVSSLLGIIMVTSGCYDLDKLRPLVKYHLPFATIDETIFRSVSMYLLAQYFRYKKNLKPDWEMNELVEIYKRIDSINANLCKRLQMACDKDSSLNAVVVLDVFAKMIPMSIEDTLVDFEHLFSIYLDEEKDQLKPDESGDEQYKDESK